MDRFDPFVKYADVYGDIINWEKDPMNKPQNQNKYFFSDGKTYYEQICKMLRLMSVFKEAFNQIYSNEDEISEAWENFVNNLSASVVEGSEPDVTLTWTEDSVNFEFTMVPGVQGDPGVGITSISFNSDYTMTITLSDGNTYTSMSLKGETGPQGPQGETGSGLQILDVYATLADLQSAHPTGQPGDAYQVGSAGNYTLYIWSSSQSAWIPAGSLGTVSPSTSNPLMDGTASAGSSDLYSRGDHVHPSDTSRASKEELDALIKTSQALIDQSFTYRESPAIQDGLARIDKIKGNTLVWNQLANAGTLSVTANYSGYLNIGTFSFVANHKYLIKYHQDNTMASNTRNTLQIRFATVGQTVTENATANAHLSQSDYSWLFNSAYTDANTIVRFWVADNDVAVSYSNIMLFDLTKMGLDSLTVEEFTSLFSLPYYSYNQGSLLSFNGNGIKTVGKNLLPFDLANIKALNTSGTWNDNVYSLNQLTFKVNDDGTIIVNGTSNAVTALDFILQGANNFVGCKFNGSSQTTDQQAIAMQFFNENNVFQTALTQFNNNSLTIPNYPKCTVRIRIGNGQTLNNVVFKPMIRNANVVDDTFEPYTSSTLSLPISTYFPSGMKSAGNVYDELTPTKAITRIGAVDLGSLNWTYSSADANFATSGISSLAKLPKSTSIVAKIVTAQYSVYSRGTQYDDNIDKSVALSSSGTLFVKDSAYTTAEAFKSAMSGVYLYYELATPTETAVDLDLDFMAYEDGTEQLLPVNGSVPLTSPVIANMTYLSIDDAMEYIIDKLANVPQNTQQILESLEDDVADLQTDVGALQPAVSALQTSVGNINTNIGQLSSTVAGHTSSISDMQSDITDLNTGLNDLADTVTDNTSRIGTLESGLSATNGNVQNLETSVSDLDDTVTAQGTTVTALDSIIQDISNNPVISSLGSHELGFVAAYVSATLAANTGTKVTIPKPTIFPNNYTPLFIVGMSTGSYNVSICEIPYSFGNRDSVDCRVWNHGAQQTTQITVYILCMRQRQSQ